MISICFVAHNAYGALAGLNTGHIGGIERQQSLMAHWMADQGHDVSMVTWDEGQGDCLVGKVKVLALGHREDGLPGLRFFHPRWTGLARAMKRAGADIYYYNCGDLGLGQIALWTGLHNKKTVYSVASNPDCDPQLPTLKPWRERILYRYGLQHTDQVVAQTLRQQEMLKTGFGIHAEIIPMPCAGFNSTQSTDSYDGPPRILWVGRFSREKRLEWLLDAAEYFPHYIFDVAGAANAGTEYARALLQRAESLPNVVLHGRLIHRELGALYRRARLLCCTSVFEGFPNTFLEAWSVGLPIISTFDPDQIITRKNLGKTACSVDEIREGISDLMENSRHWQEASSAAQTYFNTHHTLDAVMPKFVQLFQQIK
ncbi:MAG: glycosyltransferase family 4 protein [Gammaproteobacteria bacterium]|nr:glycosyltransferase family 4 protein [Gammaproteobacteria bacterium]